MGRQESSFCGESSMTVERILRDKGQHVVTAPPGTTLEQLAKILADKKIGVVVMSEDGLLLQGIVSERDIVWAIAEFGPEAVSMPASAIMTTKVYMCHPVDTLDEIMRIMTEKRIRHLPVVVDEKLKGLVSLGDVAVRLQRDREQAMLESAKYRRAG